jgi:hypothetical protein
MSVQRGWPNAGHFYSNIFRPGAIFSNFVIDPNNGNGLGVRSIKSNGYIENVFMHSTPAATTTTSVFASGVTLITLARMTNIVVGEVVTDSTTGGNIAGGTTVLAVYPGQNQILLSAATLGASASAPGDTLSFAMVPALVGNPNPAVGYAWIQFKNNFNYYLGGFSGFVSPTTGGTTGSTTIHLPFIIASLGTTTLAQWQAAGLPLGFTPTVGQSFIALATGAIGGTGTVIAPGSSGIDSLEVIGDPNQMISNSNIYSYRGAWVLVQFLTDGVVTTPATNSVVGMTFFFDQSSSTVDGL